MKKVLFIAPLFHDYEKMIIEELEKMNYKVDFFPELINNWKYKIANHLSEKKLIKYQGNYYRRIESRIRDKKYDILFVIRGSKMPISFIDFFRIRNPKAKKILYQWDANRVEKFSYMVPLFDKVYSFDPYDCKSLGMKYNPLFYTNEIIKKDYNKKYDLFMMGTYLPERYDALRNILNKYSNSYKIFTYIYIPKTSLIKERINGIKLDKSICHTVPLSRNEYLDILANSKAIIDASKTAQTGLAMRVIEALAMGVKVITTNSSITSDPVYSEDNIIVIDPNNPIIPSDFINTPFKGNAKVSSLREWLNKMIVE